MCEAPPRCISPTDTSVIAIAESKLQQTFPGFALLTLWEIDTGFSNEISLLPEARSTLGPLVEDVVRTHQNGHNEREAPQPAAYYEASQHTRSPDETSWPTKVRKGTNPSRSRYILAYTTWKSRGIPRRSPPCEPNLISILRLALERDFATAGETEAGHKRGPQQKRLFLFVPGQESREVLFAVTPREDFVTEAWSRRRRQRRAQ